MWLAKLKKMMDELPEQYLQAPPEDSEESMVLPPGSKSAGPLTDEEIRLDGVCRQLWEAGLLESKAHRDLYGQDESTHPLEACLKHNQQMSLQDQEIRTVSTILLRSLQERLGSENGYAVKGHEVFIVPPVSEEDLNIPEATGWPVIKH